MVKVVKKTGKKVVKKTVKKSVAKTVKESVKTFEPLQAVAPLAGEDLILDSCSVRVLSMNIMSFCHPTRAENRRGKGIKNAGSLFANRAKDFYQRQNLYRTDPTRSVVFYQRCPSQKTNRKTSLKTNIRTGVLHRPEPRLGRGRAVWCGCFIGFGKALPVEFITGIFCHKRLRANIAGSFGGVNDTAGG